MLMVLMVEKLVGVLWLSVEEEARQRVLGVGAADVEARWTVEVYWAQPEGATGTCRLGKGGPGVAVAGDDVCRPWRCRGGGGLRVARLGARRRSRHDIGGGLGAPADVDDGAEAADWWPWTET